MKKLLTPKVRRWAYGVAAASLPILAAAEILPPAVIPYALPLVVAILYVRDDGTPID